MSELRQPRDWEAAERHRVDSPEVSWALRDLQRAVLDADAEISRRMRMSQLDYAAVGHVMDAPDGIGPADLSAALGISTGSATELVDRLERAGHVRRERHPNDRRRIVVRPTGTAVSEVLDVIAPLVSDLDALAETLTTGEQDAVARYLRAAAARMRAYVAAGAAPS